MRAESKAYGDVAAGPEGGCHALEADEQELKKDDEEPLRNQVLKLEMFLVRRRRC